MSKRTRTRHTHSNPTTEKLKRKKKQSNQKVGLTPKQKRRVMELTKEDKNDSHSHSST
jgi:hypothetical protein